MDCPLPTNNTHMLIYETHVEETKWCHVYLQVLKEEFEDTNGVIRIHRVCN
jgi:hypothetical protein